MTAKQKTRNETEASEESGPDISTFSDHGDASTIVRFYQGGKVRVETQQLDAFNALAHRLNPEKNPLNSDFDIIGASIKLGVASFSFNAQWDYSSENTFFPITVPVSIGGFGSSYSTVLGDGSDDYETNHLDFGFGAGASLGGLALGGEVGVDFELESDGSVKAIGHSSVHSIFIKSSVKVDLFLSGSDTDGGSSARLTDPRSLSDIEWGDLGAVDGSSSSGLGFFDWASALLSGGSSPSYDDLRDGSGEVVLPPARRPSELERASDEGGASSWVNNGNNPSSSSSAVAGTLKDPEHYNKTVSNLYSSGYSSGAYSYSSTTSSSSNGYTGGYRSSNANHYDQVSKGHVRSGLPIILDLDGDGVELSFGGGVSFDFDGDGFRELGSWVGRDDGFLVLDLNADGTRGLGDGVIDQTRELVLSSWSDIPDATDLQALAEFDRLENGGNGDGILDRRDAIWAELRVWQDLDQDGESDTGELKTLAALGISQIGLSYDDGSDFNDTDNDISILGNTLLGAASFTRDGTVVEGGVGDVALAYNEKGWRRLATNDGYIIEFEAGLALRYREMDGTGSANFILGQHYYTGVFGDDRGNLISGAGLLDDFSLSGGAGNDQLYGGSGDDRISGGSGADILQGGAGRDLLFIDNQDFDILGGEGYDTAIVEPDSIGVRMNMGASEIEAFIGGEGGDYVYVSFDFKGHIRVDGRGGPDKIMGGAQDDILSGGSGNDQIYGRSGDDIIMGGEGNDHLYGEGGDDMIWGGGGVDVIYASNGDDILHGGAGGDVLFGEAADDEIHGDLGNDRLYGGYGDDVLKGGAGDDHLYGQWGDDYILGGDGNDHIHGHGGDDRLEGGAGDDHFYQNSGFGYDVIIGGDGHDILHLKGRRSDYRIWWDDRQVYLASLDNQIMIDSLGVERYAFESGETLDHASASRGDQSFDDYETRGQMGLAWEIGGHNSGRNGYWYVDAAGGDDVIINARWADTLLKGGSGDDIVKGNKYNERVYGGSGNDSVDGGFGDDHLKGDEGNDLIYGGYGNDEIHGNAGKDILYGNEGNDKLWGGVGSDSLRGGSGDDEIYGGDGRDILKGGEGDDRLYGGDGSDQLKGGEGNDALFGSNGRDFLHGGDGNDLIYGGGSGDILFGDDGSDSLEGGYGNDILEGGFGHDRLFGGFGDDVLFGDSSDKEQQNSGTNDVLEGGAGDDRLIGGLGADVLNGGEGRMDIADYSLSNAGVYVILQYNTTKGGHAWRDHLISIEGLVGSAHSDTLIGDGQNNRIWGGLGDDKLQGLWGYDHLFGGLGDDDISGQQGNDTLYGEGGDDVLNGGSGHDVLEGGAGADIFVFTASQNHRDLITDFEIDVDKIQILGNFEGLDITQNGENSEIRYNGNDLITLSQIRAENLTESQFIFI